MRATKKPAQCVTSHTSDAEDADYKRETGSRNEYFAVRIWGAHAARVLVLAGSPKRTSSVISSTICGAIERKSSRARGRARLHASRVRSPEWNSLATFPRITNVTRNVRVDCN